MNMFLNVSENQHHVGPCPDTFQLLQPVHSSLLRPIKGMYKNDKKGRWAQQRGWVMPFYIAEEQSD